MLLKLNSAIQPFCKNYENIKFKFKILIMIVSFSLHLSKIKSKILKSVSCASHDLMKILFPSI